MELGDVGISGVGAAEDTGNEHPTVDPIGRQQAAAGGLGIAGFQTDAVRLIEGGILLQVHIGIFPVDGAAGKIGGILGLMSQYESKEEALYR